MRCQRALSDHSNPTLRSAIGLSLGRLIWLAVANQPYSGRCASREAILIFHVAREPDYIAARRA
jgi:hypothetical protein